MPDDMHAHTHIHTHTHTTSALTDGPVAFLITHSHRQEERKRWREGRRGSSRGKGENKMKQGGKQKRSKTKQQREKWRGERWRYRDITVGLFSPNDTHLKTLFSPVCRHTAAVNH